MAAVLVYCIVLVTIQIIYHDSLRVERTGFVFFVSILVPVSISCLAYLRPMSGRGDDRDGLFYVFLAIRDGLAVRYRRLFCRDLFRQA